MDDHCYGLLESSLPKSAQFLWIRNGSERSLRALETWADPCFHSRPEVLVRVLHSYFRSGDESGCCPGPSPVAMSNIVHSEIEKYDLIIKFKDKFLICKNEELYIPVLIKDFIISSKFAFFESKISKPCIVNLGLNNDTLYTYEENRLQVNEERIYYYIFSRNNNTVVSLSTTKQLTLLLPPFSQGCVQKVFSAF